MPLNSVLNELPCGGRVQSKPVDGLLAFLVQCVVACHPTSRKSETASKVVKNVLSSCTLWLRGCRHTGGTHFSEIGSPGRVTRLVQLSSVQSSRPSRDAGI